METMDVYDALASLATVRDVIAVSVRLLDDGYVAAHEDLAVLVVVALEAAASRVDTVHAALAAGNVTNE